MPNQELAKELRKPIIRKSYTLTHVYSKYSHLSKNNIWVTDIAGMQLISKSNKVFRFYDVLSMFVVNSHGLFL